MTVLICIILAVGLFYVIRHMINTKRHNDILHYQKSIKYLKKEITKAEDHIIVLKDGRLKRNIDEYNEFERTVKQENPDYYRLKIKDLREDISWDRNVIHRLEYGIEDNNKQIKEYEECLSCLLKKVNK